MRPLQKSDPAYGRFVEVLSQELIPAMGCTEPVSIAYAAALARQALGTLPEQVAVTVSRNIVKNVKSVVVPNTNGLKGIEAAVAAGIVAGDPSLELEVISRATEAQRAEIQVYRDTHRIDVTSSEEDILFLIDLTATAQGHTAQVVLQDGHTEVRSITLDGVSLFAAPPKEAAEADDGAWMRVETILDFVQTMDPADVAPWVERQIQYNLDIAQEGMSRTCGANIGKVLLHHQGQDVLTRARAMAASGSDARMSGCEKPVVIISGSGNQGIAASVPVAVYAQELGCSHETLLRAVTLSDLLTVHLKRGIGCLSAYCGAVSAGCAAGAAISYLQGGGYREICHTLVNSLAIISGVVCDGAKSSCAAKIAFAVEAGVYGAQMFADGQQFYGGDGIVTKGVENTIRNVGRLGHDGMKETDKEIIRIMMEG